MRRRTQVAAAPDENTTNRQPGAKETQEHIRRFFAQPRDEGHDANPGVVLCRGIFHESVPGVVVAGMATSRRSQSLLPALEHRC